MESIISDKNAMDPEVVVPEGIGAAPAAATTALWVGLPHSWALAVFLVAGAAVMLWGAPTCLTGLVVAALIACMRGSCAGVQRTGAGAWLKVLHHATSLASLAHGLCTTLQYMGGGKLRTWLSDHMAHSPDIFPVAVLIFIALLFILGLERSRLLRTLLMGGIPATLLLLLLGSFLYYNSTLLPELYQPPLTLIQVVECSAFFTLIFSGTLEKTPNDEKLALSSFAAVLVMVLSCLFAVVFLTVIVERETLDVGVLLINALEHNSERLKGSEVWLARDGLAVLATLCLSLSLVEVLAACQRSISTVAGHILPAHVARDNRWTGTQLLAILLAGLLSCVLAYISSLSSLLMLSSACYLLSHSCDLLSAVYRQYQPSFVPRHSVEDVEGGGSYQLLSDTTRLVDSSDSEAELSDDSGHSSDTDIDAVVHEYKETIKVVTTRAEPMPMPEPSVSSARHATYSLLALVLASAGLGVSVAREYTYLPAFGVLEVVLFTCIISRQPQQLDPSFAYPLSPWRPCTTLCLNIVLTSQLLPRIWVHLLVWSCIGLGLWMYNKRRQWFHIQARLRSHTERVKLRAPPQHRTALSFLPSYRKLSHIDTVHIVR